MKLQGPKKHGGSSAAQKSHVLWEDVINLQQLLVTIEGIYALLSTNLYYDGTA